MIDAKNAKVGDMLADESGKVWRVYGLCSEPVVFIEELEPDDAENKIRWIGGITGQMWHRMSRVQ